MVTGLNRGLLGLNNSLMNEGCICKSSSQERTDASSVKLCDRNSLEQLRDTFCIFRNKEGRSDRATPQSKLSNAVLQAASSCDNAAKDAWSRSKRPARKASLALRSRQHAIRLTGGCRIV